MPLTRAWSIILAILATACLAGMFLLSADRGGGFGEADRAAVRAVAEAGVAALDAQIQASPVQQAGSVMQSARLKEALVAPPDPDDPDAWDVEVYDALGEAAEETRVRTGSNMTVALIDKTGAVMAVSGAAEKDLPELIASKAFQDAPEDEDMLFSIALADQLNVAKVIRPDAEGRRLVAVEPLQIGAGSLLRRVLGSSTPAALIRKGHVSRTLYVLLRQLTEALASLRNGVAVKWDPVTDIRGLLLTALAEAQAIEALLDREIEAKR